MAKSNWFYKAEETRQGPFSEKEIRNLIEEKIISPDTVLCDAKNNCYLAVRTEFSAYFPQQELTAISAVAVSGVWIWVLIAIPIFADLLNFAVYFAGKMPSRTAMLPLIAILVAMDGTVLQKAGFQPVKNALGYAVLFYPAYLFKRSRRLARKQTLFALSLLMFLFPVATSFVCPLLDKKDIEPLGVQIVNQILLPLHPETTVECTRVTLERRLPWAKFDVTAHLSDGRTMELLLEQSWNTLQPKTIHLPEDLGSIFIMKKFKGIQKP
ncbi:MAG: DUF4339 domain-containing protein [Synergistaceae bacterium]|nr:DUF4339 domain-containing protein [Synergistaceae bacterium]